MATTSTHFEYKFFFLEFFMLTYVITEQIELPPFSKLKANYPGYRHHGGKFDNHRAIHLIGCSNEVLLHDTSALRLSYALNKVGGYHSLGKDLIRLSKFGRDSVTGREGLQFIYHPIAFGPYMADKYGYPKISKLHQIDPLETKRYFWGKQGILRVITYTKIGNIPKGHVALWDCDHFHQSKDWIGNHTLITVEFWESADTDCSRMKDEPPPPQWSVIPVPQKNKPTALNSNTHRSSRGRFFKKYFHAKINSRHSKKDTRS